MSRPPHVDLSRRERQIMDVIHRSGRATVSEIQAAMDDDATYSAIRSALRQLREKNVICHEHDGKRYVYLPVMPAHEARRSALEHLMGTFFDGSHRRTVSAILEMSDTDLDDEELEQLEALIRRAKKKRDRR